MLHSLKAAFRAQVEEQFSPQAAGRDEILSQKDVDSLPESRYGVTNFGAISLTVWP
jgi:hypothetical protein